MARTYKTTKARTARILSRLFVKKVNEKDMSDGNQLRAALQTLEVNGVRLGNKRKGSSQDKVLKRRSRRKRENQAQLETE